jgi:hypothetical protein
MRDVTTNPFMQFDCNVELEVELTLDALANVAGGTDAPSLVINNTRAGATTITEHAFTGTNTDWGIDINHQGWSVGALEVPKSIDGSVMERDVILNDGAGVHILSAGSSFKEGDDSVITYDGTKLVVTQPLNDGGQATTTVTADAAKHLHYSTGVVD